MPEMHNYLQRNSSSMPLWNCKNNAVYNESVSRTYSYTIIEAENVADQPKEDQTKQHKRRV